MEDSDEKLRTVESDVLQSTMTITMLRQAVANMSGRLQSMNELIEKHGVGACSFGMVPSASTPLSRSPFFVLRMRSGTYGPQWHHSPLARETKGIPVVGKNVISSAQSRRVHVACGCKVRRAECTSRACRCAPVAGLL